MAREYKEKSESTQTAENKAEEEQTKVLKDIQKYKQESVYTVAELAANAVKIFKCRPECMVAAMTSAGRTECTVSEAKDIINKFLKKEVR